MRSHREGESTYTQRFISHTAYLPSFNTTGTDLNTIKVCTLYFAVDNALSVGTLPQQQLPGKSPLHLQFTTVASKIKMLRQLSQLYFISQNTANRSQQPLSFSDLTVGCCCAPPPPHCYQRIKSSYPCQNKPLRRLHRDMELSEEDCGSAQVPGIACQSPFLH